MNFSLRNDSQMIGRPIQNAITDAKTTNTMPIQNIARGGSSYWITGMVSGPDRFHKIAVNDTIETTALIAPNSSVLPEP